jgi:hypothetical protein
MISRRVCEKKGSRNMIETSCHNNRKQRRAVTPKKTIRKLEKETGGIANPIYYTYAQYVLSDRDLSFALFFIYFFGSYVFYLIFLLPSFPGAFFNPCLV